MRQLQEQTQPHSRAGTVRAPLAAAADARASEQQQQGRDCSLDWARGVKHCATKMMANGIGHMQAHAAADAPAVTAAALEAPAS